MARAAVDAEVGAPAGGRAGRAADAARQRGHADAATHGRAGRLEEVHGVRPVAQEDRAPVAEVTPAQLLVGRGHPRRAHAGDDQRAQEREPACRALFLRKDGAVGAEHPPAVRPDGFQRVDGESLVLAALPHDAVQAPVVLGAAHAHDLVDERLPRPGRRQPILREQIGAVIEDADVHQPRHRPHAAVPRRGLDGGRKVRRQLRPCHPRREVEQPARAREFRDPDDVEHHHVEGGAVPLEVDHEELVLVVRIPRERLRLHADAGMPLLELPEQAGDRVGGAEDLGVLEDEGDGSGLVKGYEFTKEQYVRVADDELKALEGEASKMIDILEFVPLAQVDPVYFEKAYYLGADKGGEKPYRLLADAMAQAEQVAVAKFVMRGKESLVLIRPAQEGLLLHTMFFADEVRSFADVDKGQSANVREGELDLALQLIRGLARDEFKPEQYKDEYRGRGMDMLERKVEGREITAAPATACRPTSDRAAARRGPGTTGSPRSGSPSKARWSRRR